MKKLLLVGLALMLGFVAEFLMCAAGGTFDFRIGGDGPGPGVALWALILHMPAMAICSVLSLESPRWIVVLNGVFLSLLAVPAVLIAKRLISRVQWAD
jgi:hypothetical protein